MTPWAPPEQLPANPADFLPFRAPGPSRPDRPRADGTRSRRWRGWGELPSLVGIVVGAVLLGAPLGVIWSHVSPRAAVVIYASNQADLVDAEPSAFITADVVFLLLVLAAGALLGLLVWRCAPRTGPVTVIGLLVGGVLAGLIAARVGSMIGRGAFVHAVHAGHPGRVLASIKLRARAAVLAWPVGALVSFGVLSLRDGRPSSAR